MRRQNRTCAQCPPRRRQAGGVRVAGAACLAALFLSGCATLSLDTVEGQGGSGQGGSGGGQTEQISVDPTYGAPPPAPPTDLDPRQLEQYYRRAAEIAMAERQLYGAVAHLSRVLETSPGDQRVAYDLARHLRYVGATVDGERVLTGALERNPGDALLRLEMAKNLIAQGRADDAVALLTTLRQERPRDPAILSTLGVAQDRRGDHAAAREAYDAAIALGSPSAALLNNAGLSRLLNGDATGAVTLLRRAAGATGATAQVTQNLALALVMTGEREEARRLIESSMPAEAAGRALAYYERLAQRPETLRDAWSMAAAAG